MFTILVVSDTHGDCRRVVSYLEKNQPDHIFHLGDMVADARALATKTTIPITFVKGNCDYYETAAEDLAVFTYQQKKIVLTHGHLFHVKRSLQNLVYKGLELEADAILFGHTHQRHLSYEGRLLIMNPGSASLPRDGLAPSFGLIEIDDQLHPALASFEN